jgi:hypothetical protein
VHSATRSTVLEDQNPFTDAESESHEVEPTDDEEPVAGGGDFSG